VLRIWPVFDTVAPLRRCALRRQAAGHECRVRVDSGRSPILERIGLHPAKQDGPVVVEVPPAVPGASFFGTIEDSWYVAVVDIGFEGKGGKY